MTLAIPEGATDVEAQARTGSARGDSERGSRGRGSDDGDRGDRDNSGRGNADDRGDRNDDRGSRDDDRGQSGSGRGELRDENDLRVRVDGPVSVGEEITILVTDVNGDPVPGAEIEINDVDAGVTGADGTLVFLVPADATQLEIEAKRGDADGELIVAF